MPVKGPSNMALVFGALVAGAVVIDYGVKNAKAAFSPPSSTGGNSNAVAVSGYPQSVNPLPGATTSRLDQGIDATGRKFLSPWNGKVLKAVAHDPGWGGGGYIAIQSDQDPSFVYYLAEGVTNAVHVGESVTAGQVIAYPVANPYNGIIGNVEFGRANPANPGQPLAQVTGDAKAMVDEFAQWFERLGGSQPTSTANAGSS